MKKWTTQFVSSIQLLQLALHCGACGTLPTQRVVVAGRVVDLDEEDEHDEVDEEGVEVGHVEGGSQTPDERVSAHDGRHQGGGQLHAQAVHQARHHCSATWRMDGQTSMDIIPTSCVRGSWCEWYQLD